MDVELLEDQVAPSIIVQQDNSPSIPAARLDLRKINANLDKAEDYSSKSKSLLGSQLGSGHRHADDRSARISMQSQNIQHTLATTLRDGLVAGEELDKELLKNVPPEEIQNATHNLLGFAKQPSFENAFFIVPETEENLKDILYVHVSVNLLNSFLSEICSKDFGQSRERVKKIESVLQGMIEYMEGDQNLEQEEEEILDQPYSMEANDKIKSRIRILKEKQKLMREMRVMEQCVQILHVPFASGVFDFNKMKQDWPITSICNLTYILLGKIIAHNTVNEIYASQWIGLYLKHILATNTANQIGADSFLTLLSDDNISILKKGFDPMETDTIKNFLQRGQRSIETPRLLQLLKAICSCHGKPIQANQSAIIRLMIQDSEENKKKFLITLKKLKKADKDFQICINASEKNEYESFSEFIEKVEKINEKIKLHEKLQEGKDEEDEKDPLKKDEKVLLADYNCFLGILELLSEACLGQNQECHTIVQEYFDLKLLASFVEQQYPYPVRKRALAFFANLHLNRPPPRQDQPALGQYGFEKVIVPSETMIWSQLPDPNESGQALIDCLLNNKYIFVMKKGSRIPRTFGRLKLTCEKFLKDTKGVVVFDDIDKNEMIYEILNCIHFMTQHGFYTDQEDIKALASSVIQVLSGQNDKFEDGRQLGIKRYLKSKENDTIVLIKQRCCDILTQLSCLELDQKCTIFYGKLKRDIESSDPQPLSSQKSLKKSGFLNTCSEQELKELREYKTVEKNAELFDAICESKGFESIIGDKYVCILFDLLLYRYPELSRRVYSLLVRYFLRKRSNVEALSKVQLLESKASIAALEKVKMNFHELTKLKNETTLWITANNEYGTQAKKQVTKIFQEFADLCVIKDDTEGNEKTTEAGSPTLRKMKMINEHKFFDFHRTKEDFYLYDMPEIKVNKESQRLMRDFNISAFALHFIKQSVDRQTNYNEDYTAMIKQCYWFLTAFVRENLQNQLRVYDDLDYFMRDFDKYQCATVLVYEIFRNNKKFLTLNVTKFLRGIVNASEEMEIGTAKKSAYLKLLQVFLQLYDKKVRQNQTEIVLQFTVDTTKSNLLYFFLDEGKNELQKHLDPCLVVHYDQDEKSKALNDSNKDQQVGIQYIKIQIFNVIQLLELMTLCCEGKSTIAERRCADWVLSFAVASHIVKMAGQFWPLKIAVVNYINECFLQCDDKQFLAKPEDEEKEGDENKKEDEETDIQVLLNLVDNLNEDLESYLEGKILDHQVKLPTGKTLSMMQQAEQYIFKTGVVFMEHALRRKTYDVGAFDMKFFTITENLCNLYYETENLQYKMNIMDLLLYMNFSENHSKYLDDVRHPAKKRKENNEEFQKLDQALKEEQIELNNQTSVDNSAKSTKSSKLTLKLNQLIMGKKVREQRERQFETIIDWIVRASEKISSSYLNQENPFPNVRFNSIIGSVINLLDANILERDLQLCGIKLLRKIVEVENSQSETHEPAADWNADDWTEVRQNIKMKQNMLVERGTIPFLCKLLSETEELEIQKECLLVMIALLIGGNLKSQDKFFQYMTKEDVENKLLDTVQKMLKRSFELTKKYLTEKNSKLEMIQKVKKDAELKEKQREKNAKLDIQFDEDSDDSEDQLMSIESDIENEQEEEKDEKGANPIQMEDQAQLKNNEAEKRQHMNNCIRVLRFLQLLCEGHHTQLQNHLREQMTEAGVRNQNSFNFVAYTSTLLGVYVKSYVNCYSTDLGNQLIESLIEFVQGPCRKNQITLVETKVIDCGRDLLAQGSISKDDLEKKGFEGERKERLDQLKSNSVKLLLAILEGPVNEAIYEKVAASLGDFLIVISRMTTLYKEFVTEVLEKPETTKPEDVNSALQKDSFDGSISEGFDIYSLLYQIVAVIEKEKVKLKEFESTYSYIFYTRNSGKIEVNIEENIQQVFFIIRPICWNLTTKTRDNFVSKVNRSSQQDKIQGLIAAVPGFIAEMDQIDAMKKTNFKIPPEVILKVRDVSTLIALMIATIIIIGYRWDFVLREDGAYDYMPYMEPIYATCIMYFGYMQLLSSSVLLVGFWMNERGLVVKEGWRKRIEQNQNDLQVEKKNIERIRENNLGKLDVKEIDMGVARMILQIEGPYSEVFKQGFYHTVVKFEYYWICLSFLIQSKAFIFAIQYLALSVQGMVQSPVFYSLHLLDVINRFQTLQNVIKSVTTNLQQLLLTAMLGVIIIYIYGVIAYLFISDLYFDEGIHQGLINKAGDSICMSLLHCFLSTFNYGLRTGGGIGEFLPAETGASYNSIAFTVRFFFDLSFFLLVIIILLNVIFGIIIDTFAQLREKASDDENDTKNVCFICGYQRVELDRDTDAGFNTHVEEDHDMWNYVYFIIHLQSLDRSEMNGVESAIDEQNENEETGWFPLMRCLRIIKDQKKRNESASDSNAFEKLQKKMQLRYNQADESLKNIESLLS